MDRNEKKEFIRALSGGVVAKMLDDIDAGKVPESWDGHELRPWLADRFETQTSNMDKRRVREYHNTVLVNDL
ncbi:MAG: hypothetical protein EHM35_07330 [Planctomycetaceae bacterium]|nr:MAG: hypothetical protein EHM35_07330 [Planctomycetaceae bacterium]